MTLAAVTAAMMMFQTLRAAVSPCLLKSVIFLFCRGGEQRNNTPGIQVLGFLIFLPTKFMTPATLCQEMLFWEHVAGYSLPQGKPPAFTIHICSLPRCNSPSLYEAALWWKCFVRIKSETWIFQCSNASRAHRWDVSEKIKVINKTGLKENQPYLFISEKYRELDFSSLAFHGNIRLSCIGSLQGFQ